MKIVEEYDKKTPATLQDVARFIGRVQAATDAPTAAVMNSVPKVRVNWAGQITRLELEVDA